MNESKDGWMNPYEIEIHPLNLTASLHTGQSAGSKQPRTKCLYIDSLIYQSTVFICRCCVCTVMCETLVTFFHTYCMIYALTGHGCSVFCSHQMDSQHGNRADGNEAKLSA